MGGGAGGGPSLVRGSSPSPLFPLGECLRIFPLSHRRAPGGVFFSLLKKEVSPEDIKVIFEKEIAIKKLRRSNYNLNKKMARLRRDEREEGAGHQKGEGHKKEAGNVFSRLGTRLPEHKPDPLEQTATVLMVDQSSSHGTAQEQVPAPFQLSLPSDMCVESPADHLAAASVQQSAVLQQPATLQQPTTLQQPHPLGLATCLGQDLSTTVKDSDEVVKSKATTHLDKSQRPTPLSVVQRSAFGLEQSSALSLGQRSVVTDDSGERSAMSVRSVDTGSVSYCSGEEGMEVDCDSIGAERKAAEAFEEATCDDLTDFVLPD